MTTVWTRASEGGRTNGELGSFGRLVLTRPASVLTADCGSSSKPDR